jgi:hypothetical protein
MAARRAIVSSAPVEAPVAEHDTRLVASSDIITHRVRDPANPGREMPVEFVPAEMSQLGSVIGDANDC